MENTTQGKEKQRGFVSYQSYYSGAPLSFHMPCFKKAKNIDMTLMHYICERAYSCKVLKDSTKSGAGNIWLFLNTLHWIFHTINLDYLKGLIQ